MKKRQLLKTTVLIAFIFSMYGCEKATPATPENSCRTCTARYMGSTVATKNACSAQDEKDFNTQYYYAEVSCR
ncbi:MAG: hypothetical protein ABIQ07_01135 [Ginsengibacter sp.]